MTIAVGSFKILYIKKDGRVHHIEKDYYKFNPKFDTAYCKVHA